MPVPDQEGEVEVEDLVEAGPVVLTLDQRRGVRRPQGLAPVDTERVDRLDRIEALGERDREPGVAQRLHELDVPVEEAHVARNLSSRTARSWSLACLSTTPRVRSMAAASRVPVPSAARVRAQSMLSAIDGALRSSIPRSLSLIH